MTVDDKPRGKRGAGYIRVRREKATGGKAEEKTSPEAQKATIRDWCKRHSLPEPQRWYVDVEGKNSRDTWEAREQFEQMVAEADRWHFMVANRGG